MNAYELADELENQQTIASLTTLRKIATMLRQQADRIAELEKPSKQLSDDEILKIAADKFHYSEYKLAIEFARAIIKEMNK